MYRHRQPPVFTVRGTTKWQWSFLTNKLLEILHDVPHNTLITFHFQVQSKDGPNYDINTSFLSKWNERTVNPSGHGSSAAEMM